MIKKNILKKTVLTILIATSLSNTAYSLDIQSYLINKDYSQQKEIIDENIKLYQSKLNSLIIKQNNLEEFLNQNKNEILDINKQYLSKKIENKYNNSFKNDLIFLEVLLNSDSLSEFFSRIDLAKDLYIQKNKTLNSLIDKQQQLLEIRNKKLQELDSINNDIKNLEADLSQLKTIENDLYDLMKRKSENLHFNPDNLLEKSNLSVQDMYEALKNTSLYDLAPVYIEAENTYGINAIFLAGLCANESDWGRSNRAIQDNNLTGFGVFNSNSIGINANSKRDNILMTAKCLKEKYLSPSGRYFSGYSISNVNSKYCLNSEGFPDYSWSETITSICFDILNKINK